MGFIKSMFDKKTKREIDLSDSYVILGSGLTAISTIHGIHDSKYKNTKKIFVIDAGLTKDSKLDFTKRNHVLKAPSPKFKIRANNYVYDSFKTMLNITENGFEAVGSLAKGGLSNIWGATIQPYQNEELRKFPYSFDEIKVIYTKIFKILTGSKNKNFINKDIKEKEFIVSDPLLAINPERKAAKSCNLKLCDDGCINCNKNIFNSKNEIDVLKSFNKIEYMPGLFIESVKLEGDYYIIKCKEIPTNQEIFIRASVIYCCLGAISTSKIVLSMSDKINNKLPLLSTPGGSFFMFSNRDFHKKNHKILSSKSFAGKLDDHNYEGNIFPFSKNLVCTYFGELLGGCLNHLFGKLLFSKLFIANIYFDSDMSNSKITYNDNVLKIESESTSVLKNFFKEVIKVIKIDFFSLGLLVIPFSPKLLLPGQDIHYGGSIPMKKNPQINQCNYNGELKGFKNFYISDASSMPFLASKGQSFNAMVNAYYIASKSVKPVG